MASNLPLIVFLLLVSLSLTSGYSLFTRDAVSKQDDESNVMAMHTSGQGSSTILVEDLVKAQSPQARVDGSEVVVNEAVSKKSSYKRNKDSKKEYKKSKKIIGSLDISDLLGYIFGAVVVTIVIICFIYFLWHKTKKAQVLDKASKPVDHV